MEIESKLIANFTKVKIGLTGLHVALGRVSTVLSQLDRSRSVFKDKEMISALLAARIPFVRRRDLKY